MTKNQNSKKARIEVFRPGTFTPMGGKPLTFSAAELRAAADAYDPAIAPAPIVVGHPSADTPAFGWAEKFDYDAGSERMGATVGDIAPEFAEAVQSGRYRKVSMAWHSPTAPNNPVPGVWYPKHIGFLGGAAPAVPGLKNVSFAADQEGVVEFSMPLAGSHDLQTLIASFADLLLGRGQEASAPKIEWLDDGDGLGPHQSLGRHRQG
ncbi:MAG: hypothetical protein Q4G24_12650 [Paracoccus sp. (in: a-proteobacteria)]|uniref:hypothetical protein n=1 Tax=Paracoccus sp. TaxID=267 RepID=UPI0026E04CE4|nr:hypothetical protein [Paracoccus sp. (in: a-proteobacteria)]MDO5622308.1 hypothetical protein [Paracoccus sp. (in: a-proteobacteria)]